MSGPYTSSFATVPQSVPLDFFVRLDAFLEHIVGSFLQHITTLLCNLGGQSRILNRAI